ncbi:hypothetical protein [Labrys wisconsinensis]|uniref:Uncharacterized protein n=1 Tax=Labrys wisconsinensis TaxID=425677 RepID=A0ABU0J7U2_9HYPH|nr:hypothetical protein [Labrys wisconsinensis]MDQ0470337.1 hypothetical protein [Labrys wisconsinensis]
MAADFKGYMDDSFKDPLLVIGGYVGGYLRWEFFEAEWSAVLGRHGVPYFHMKEMASPTGVYAKWHPIEEHKEEVRSFLSDLTKIITESRLVAILSLVRLADLDRFEKERKLKLDPYVLAIYGCMRGACEENPGFNTELVFDHFDKTSSRLRKASEYASHSSDLKDNLPNIKLTPLNRDITSRKILPLQAADLAAWEFRKHHDNVKESLDLVQDILDADFAWEVQEQWILDRFGSHEKTMRKSAQALFVGNEVYPRIWDYKTLNEAHELQNGIWCS